MSNTLRIAMLTLAATALASAASYRITIPVAVVVDGDDVKPGEYTLNVKDDNTAVLKGGKINIETKVKTEPTDRKFDSTAVRYSQEGGKYNMQEIQLGGKKSKLVFESSHSANGGL